MMAADPRPARRAVARLVQEIDHAARIARADDDEFQEAAHQARDLLANAAGMLETLQHVEALALQFMANPKAELHPARLIADIYLVTRISLDEVEGVVEQ